MPYNYPEIKKFLGLYLQANSFEVPDGALEVASNVVLSKDNILSKRRGFYAYYTPSAETINNLGVFGDQLFAIFTNKVASFTDTGSSPNITGTKSTLSGATVSVSGDRVARNCLSNRNFYFTTDNGVLKLDALTGPVFTTGIPPALDLNATFTTGTVIAASMLVGYRVIFGRYDAENNLLLSAPSQIVQLNNTDAVNPKNVRLEFSIPSEITDSSLNWFYRIYRSSQVSNASALATIASDFALIQDTTLTSGDLTTGFIIYNDSIPDVLRGDQLYTNENSREGEAQSNFRPPLCNDIALYKGYVVYGACTTRQLLQLNIVDPTQFTDGANFEVKVDSTTRRYIPRSVCGNITTTSTSVAGSAGDLQVTYNGHNLLNNTEIYISSVVAGSLTAGTYYTKSVATNTFKISTTINGSNIAFNSETSLDFQGERTTYGSTVSGAAWVRSSNVVTVTSTAHGLSPGFGVYISASSGGSPDVSLGIYSVVSVPTANSFTIASTGADDASGNTLTYTPYDRLFAYDVASSSAAARLANTAGSIVKAINRDASSVVYAAYTSGIAGVPGQMAFTAKGFGGAIYVRTNNTAMSRAFSPIPPIDFSSGVQVYSRNDDLTASIFISKFDEPEAVPLVNQFPVGAANKQILRILSLRDSLIILKEDGVYRLSGDTINNFIITLLDSTVICAANSSAVVLNNQVMLLSNQGVCLVTESSVQIVSRNIEDVIQPILGEPTLSAQTSAFAYESERQYGLSTLDTNTTTAALTYLYNILNNSWYSWDLTFTQGLVGPNDTLYIITTDGTLQRERKSQSRIDYSGQYYSLTVNSVDSDKLGALVTFATSVVPQIGDFIEKNSTFSKIIEVENIVSDTWQVNFLRATNIVAADSLFLYSKIESIIKTAPFHAGLVGRMKQFAQMQAHFRDNSISEVEINFSGDTIGSSPTTTWTSPTISRGWGHAPWGFFPWGQSDSAAITKTTGTAPICRVYVPQIQQRGTFLQVQFTHNLAGEAINLQSISFAIRAYNERTSK